MDSAANAAPMEPLGPRATSDRPRSRTASERRVLVLSKGVATRHLQGERDGERSPTAIISTDLVSQVMQEYEKYHWYTWFFLLSVAKVPPMVNSELFYVVMDVLVWTTWFPEEPAPATWVDAFPQPDAWYNTDLIHPPSDPIHVCQEVFCPQWLVDILVQYRSIGQGLDPLSRRMQEITGLGRAVDRSPREPVGAVNDNGAHMAMMAGLAQEVQADLGPEAVISSATAPIAPAPPPRPRGHLQYGGAALDHHVDALADLMDGCEIGLDRRVDALADLMQDCDVRGPRDGDR